MLSGSKMCIFFLRNVMQNIIPVELITLQPAYKGHLLGGGS